MEEVLQGILRGGRVKDAAPGPFVRVEAQHRSAERQQVLLCKGLKGASQCSPHTCVSRIWGNLYEERRVDHSNNNNLIDWSPRRS